MADEKAEVTYASTEAGEFDDFLGGGSEENIVKETPSKEEKAEPEEKPASKEESKEEFQITDEQKEEMDDFQGLLDKGKDNLSEEEKARVEDYSKRYNIKEEEEDKEVEGIRKQVENILKKDEKDRTEEENKFLEDHLEPEEDDKKKKEDKTPEAWKDYKEADLIKLIEEGKYDDVTDDHIEFLKSLGHKIEVEEPENKEDSKEKEEKKEEKTPAYVERLKNVEFFKDREVNEESISEYIDIQEDTNQKLTEILNKNPELTGVLSDLAKGKEPGEAIKTHFEDLFNEEAPKPGEDGYEEYVTKKIEKRQALQRENEQKAQREQNMQKSSTSAVKFAQTKNLDQSQAKEFFGQIDRHIQDLTSGVVSDDILNLVYKGLNYEKDLKNAEEIAETRGANRKISLQKSDRKGDGIRRVKIRHVPKEVKNRVTYANPEAKEFEDFMTS